MTISNDRLCRVFDCPPFGNKVPFPNMSLSELQKWFKSMEFKGTYQIALSPSSSESNVRFYVIPGDPIGVPPKEQCTSFGKKLKRVSKMLDRPLLNISNRVLPEGWVMGPGDSQKLEQYMIQARKQLEQLGVLPESARNWTNKPVTVKDVLEMTARPAEKPIINNPDSKLCDIRLYEKMHGKVEGKQRTADMHIQHRKETIVARTTTVTGSSGSVINMEFLTLTGKTSWQGRNTPSS